MRCPHCNQETKVLVFHENGLNSCHACAPEVRKMAPAQKHVEKYRKTGRGYLIAR